MARLPASTLVSFPNCGCITSIAPYLTRLIIHLHIHIYNLTHHCPEFQRKSNTKLRRENITVGMRSACCFFVSVFLATVVASASTLTPADASKNEMWAAKMGNKLNHFIVKRYRFPISTGIGKGVGSSGIIKEDAPSTNIMDTPNSVSDFAHTSDKRFDMIEHQHKKKMSKGKKFKVCLNHGPCYMKRLVCPKNCNHKKSHHHEIDLTGHHKKSHLKFKHTKGHCTFNCKKCIAHC